MKLQRRDFIKLAAATTALPAVAAETPAATVVVVHGTDPAKMLTVGVEKLGGWSKFIKKGMKVVLKPNVAWYSTPEEGGNTAPELVREFVVQAEKCGAAKVDIPENPCAPEDKAFPRSGVIDALKGTSAKLFRPNARKGYRKVAIPKGKVCTEAEVTNEILDCDCLVNMPVAKHHGGALLTLAMKNWMGAISNKTRRTWHRDGLHQCIADFSTFIKPALTVIDATRILLEKGPQGPGALDHPNVIVLSTDPVAADAYAATLFDGKLLAGRGKARAVKPFDVGYIKIAHEMGVGCGDLSKVNIVKVEC